MIIDTVWNILLFAGRGGVTIICFVLTLNLIADMRHVILSKRNGLWHTRLALVVLLVSLFLDNGLYSIGHIHSGFQTIPFAHWIEQVLPLFVVAKMATFYGILMLYKLFRTNNKK